MSTQLTNHFTYEEVNESEKAEQLGITNVFPIELVDAIKSSAAGMERIREILGVPIHIDSWYRCLELNRALKSKDTSQHVRGEAVDWIAPTFGDPLKCCKEIIKHRFYINFDQLILEHGWVHTSFCANPGAVPRNTILSLLATGKYSAGLTDMNGKPYDSSDGNKY